MEESATLAMTKKSRELKAQGIDVINLSIGEPDFFVPSFIKEATKNAVDNNFSFYPPVAGYQNLRSAIANKLKRDNGLNFTADQIVVSNGAKQSIANLFLTLLNPGDEVLVPTPYWVSYAELIKLAGGVPVFIHAGIEQEFKVSPSQIEQAISSRTKAFIFSSPCNPSGTVYTKSELKDFAYVLGKYKHIAILSDEIYELITFSGKHVSIGSFDEVKDQTITINGVSKAFAMPGYRIGYMAGPLAIAKAVEKIQGQLTSSPSSIAQMAALAAVSANPDDTQEINIMREAFRERRDIVLKMLAEIPGLRPNNPEGAFYVFPNVSDLFGKSANGFNITNDNDLCIFLLKEANVALVPGSAFGNSDCIRISYATSNEILIEALRRISKTISLLK